MLTTICFQTKGELADVLTDKSFLLGKNNLGVLFTFLRDALFGFVHGLKKAVRGFY
jgi:hypothetical protein